MTLLTCLHITRLAENQVTQLITRQQTPETLPSVALLWKSFPFTVLVAGPVSPLRLVLISSTLHPAGNTQTDQSWSCCDQRHHHSVLRPQCWVISSVKPSLKSVQTVSWASEDKYFCKNVPVGSHFYAVKSWLIGYIRRLVKTSCDCICFKSEEWKNSENGRAKPGDWGSRQISGRKKGCQFLDLLSKKNKKKHLFCCVNVYQWKSLQTLNVCHFSGNRDMRGSSGYHQ